MARNHVVPVDWAELYRLKKSSIKLDQHSGAYVPSLELHAWRFYAGWSTESCIPRDFVKIYMKPLKGFSTVPSRASLFKMKPLNGLFFLMSSTTNVLAKPYTNEDAVIGPDGVKCSAEYSVVSVRNPDNLLTFHNGHCVYSTSTDQCKTGVALFQFYSLQNVCPQGMSYSACFNYLCLRSSATKNGRM